MNLTLKQKVLEVLWGAVAGLLASLWLARILG